ncbi:MAG: phosphoribosylamine--glycine ligase [Lachnospiraceae bacterium]|jgi:phosphoribosylamine--glycine ligase|nr:phosphoribosylamine--glycine ligase [Lachnospiraceae bacterium]
MTVLIIGNGGREHAIAVKLHESGKVNKIYSIPENAGIDEIGVSYCIGIDDFKDIRFIIGDLKPDLVIIGPDDPLAKGFADKLRSLGYRVFGPSKKAALIEASKSFAKDLMKKYNIPTAAYEVFDEAATAIAYIKNAKYPLVIKADGLAKGKGVLICNDYQEAYDGIRLIMEERHFGSAGEKIVIEEFLVGHEVSIMAFVDGKTVKTMTSVQDHKRIGDGDTGLNTGGMGTFSPSPYYTEAIDEYCQKHIYQATVTAMKAEGREFKGILFFGLILTAEGPKVLEYNARFGDPETQVVLPRMKSDFLDAINACIDGNLDQIDLEFDDEAAVCVILASEGYPEKYKTGVTIFGTQYFDGKHGYYCFHAGTRNFMDSIVTTGGRVFGITAKGADLNEARERAYEATNKVIFENKYMRNDIGVISTAQYQETKVDNEGKI